MSTDELRARHVATLQEMFAMCANERRMQEADSLAAAIEALGAPGGWLPIESAPKDGRRILISDREDAVIARFHEVFAWVHEAEVPAFLKPTHWQPLPPPPALEVKP